MQSRKKHPKIVFYAYRCPYKAINEGRWCLVVHIQTISPTHYVCICVMPRIHEFCHSLRCISDCTNQLPADYLWPLKMGEFVHGTYGATISQLRIQKISRICLQFTKYCINDAGTKLLHGFPKCLKDSILFMRGSNYKVCFLKARETLILISIYLKQ